MSASTRNVQGTLGLRQLGEPLAVVAALAVVLIVALAVGQLATSISSTGVSKSVTIATDPMAQANSIGKSGVGVSKSVTIATDPMAQANSIGKSGVGVSKSVTTSNGVGSRGRNLPR